MNVKTELVNAIKLFLLLCLLFWSFTWNSNSSDDFSKGDERRSSPSSREHRHADISKSTNHHSHLVESFSTEKNAFVQSSTTHVPSGMIPPFNEWKQNEKTKHDKGSATDEVIPGRHRKVSGRKLNYSSSKCGAKVLASNPEAKHRTAILSDNPEEYMLNPCRAKTWFILELCDTVEATQIELANYELYSSSPKHFSLYWSDVYPTLVWHMLGTFEAKDQRIMQTFDLGVKNLGKFIKMVIFSHHGKEHYCPLSVVRILGYSMVDEFEDLEHGKLHLSGSRLEEDEFSKSESSVYKNKTVLEIKKASAIHSNISSNKTHHLLLQRCMDTNNNNSTMTCLNQPGCRFFKVVLARSSAFSNIDTCKNVRERSIKEAVFFKKSKSKMPSFLLSEKVCKKENHVIGSSKCLVSDKATEKKSGKVKNRNTTESYQRLQKRLIPFKEAAKKSNEFTGLEYSRTVSDRTQKHEFLFRKPHRMREYCDCKDNKLTGQASRKEKGEGKSNEANNQQHFLEYIDGIDSAGLLQKESVFIKLSSRIKTLEVDLTFINKYLQQLSESYRIQMERMQILFNQTVKAISGSSKKAAEVDAQQQEAINALTKKINYLNVKVQYMMNSQKELLKRVVALHGFFIVLELIVFSTIFTIFLNIFNQKAALFINKTQKIVIRKL